MRAAAAADVANRPPHFLHVFPSFGIGGVPLRMARIINYLGSRCRHTIVALDGALDAGARVSGAVDFALVAMTPDKNGLVANLVRYGRFIGRTRPDLLLTYNWGSIEWAAVNSLWPRRRHIHLESGFGIEEASGQLGRRVLARRWGLRHAEALVIPSRTLERIAREIWRLPARKLRYIPNGIDLAAFADDGAGAPRSDDAVVIGTVAPLRPEKNVGRLVRAFAALPPSPRCRLVIVGDGIEREKLKSLAAALGVANRVSFAGQKVITKSLLSGFDIFCLSSDTEQMPNALLEAMAAGLPVAAVDVGDVRAIVAPENRALIVPRDDLDSFSKAIGTLVADPNLRRQLGDLNRQRVVSEYRQEQMFAAYEKLLLG